MARLWYFNLDAERELASEAHYNTSAKLAAQMAREAPRIAQTLCPNEPVLRAESAHELRSSDALFFAWSWTPSALGVGKRLGLRVPEAPPLDVLRRVNRRDFCLSAPLQRATAELLSAVPALQRASLAVEKARQWLPSGSPLSTVYDALPAHPLGLRAKRSYGFAGKGQLHIKELDRIDDATWLRGGLRHPLLIEPHVALVRELSFHGVVTATCLVLGAPCRLNCDSFGAPLGVTRASSSDLTFAGCDLSPLVSEAARQLGEALREAGYFGPFGCDARLFDGEAGPGITLFGDINARFTLGWSQGLGAKRDEALSVLEALY